MDPSTLALLPMEKICEVVERLDLRGLISLMGTSKEFRRTVEFCITSLRLRDGETVPASFVLSLPNLTRVDGRIRVFSVPELQSLSRRIRGSFKISIHIQGLVAGDPRNILILQAALLELPFTRAYLYPQNSYQVDLSIRDPEVGSLGIRKAAYNPSTQSLTLHLLLSGDNVGKPLTSVLPSLFQRLPVRSLDISILSLSREVFPDFVVIALKYLELEELVVSTKGIPWLVVYLLSRREAGLPVSLHRIRFYTREGIPIDGFSDSFSFLASEGISSLPSLTEIIGLSSEGNLSDLLVFFPNLRKVGVVLQEGQSLEGVAQVWRTAERGITLEEVRYS